MTRVLLVADSGPVMASITASLWALPEVEIVGYASGRAGVQRTVASMRPDVVLVDQMCWVGLALARMAEIRAVSPPPAIVGLTDRPDADWVLAGLQAGASAIVPRDLGAPTLRLVLNDVLSGSRPVDIPYPIERSAA